jgi:anti-sigma factor RsiW
MPGRSALDNPSDPSDPTDPSHPSHSSHSSHFRCPCRRRREICLFAASSLPEQDRPELERHLAACPACRNYYREIKSLAAPLAVWEDHFAHIEPTQAMQTRWAAAVQAAATSMSSTASISSTPPAHRLLLQNLCRNLWRELVWPCRRAWVGLAAIWLALLAVNARLSDHPTQMAGLNSPSASEIMQSWEEQTRVLAELTQPAHVYTAPIQPPAAPANPPRPHSERKQDWQIV